MHIGIEPLPSIFNIGRFNNMRSHEYRIHFIDGNVITVTEPKSEPVETQLHNRFVNSKPDDVLIVGTQHTRRAFIPVRNILYISTDAVD